MNLPNWFSSPLQMDAFIISFYAWGIVELINTVAIGRRRAGGRGQDRGSYFAVVIAIYLAVIAAYWTRQSGWGLVPGPLQWLGLVLVWVGMLMREWAVLSLGRAFTVVVETSPGQSLVTSGPYRWVRHPSYTGSILTLGGFGLAAGSWLGASLAAAIMFAGYSYRVYVEEQALQESFGEPYRAYKRHTGRFFPRVR